MQFWEIIGHTLVSDDQIRLTADEQSKSGAIWNIMVSYEMFWIDVKRVIQAYQ